MASAGQRPVGQSRLLLCSSFLLGFSLVMGKGLLLSEGLCCAVGYWILVYWVPADPWILAGLDIFSGAGSSWVIVVWCGFDSLTGLNTNLEPGFAVLFFVKGDIYIYFFK